jgi:hypothetical protein
MRYKLIAIFLVILSFFSCNHRCTEAMDDARAQKRDTAICYLWRYTDYCRKSSIDSGYTNFKANGDYEDAYTLKELKYGKKYVWSSTNGSFTYIGCMDNGSAISTTLKYIIQGDSLTSIGSDGSHPSYIKVSKPIP